MCGNEQKLSQQLLSWNKYTLLLHMQYFLCCVQSVYCHSKSVSEFDIKFKLTLSAILLVQVKEQAGLQNKCGIEWNKSKQYQ